MESRNPAEKVPAYNGEEGFAFFSYSHADNDQLMPYFRDVHARYRFWYDEGIKSGREWIDEIGSRIYNCDLFVVFLSKSALNSRYIKDEIFYAYKYAKHTLAVFLEPVTLSTSLDFTLGRFQHVLWYEEPDPAKRFIKLTEGFPDSIRIESAEGTVVPPEPVSRNIPRGKLYNSVQEEIDACYETVRKLGEGGFGVVELIRSRKTGAEYVMKHSRQDEENTDRKILGKAVARNELQKLLLLSDKPYVPVLIDYYESDEDYFLLISKITGLNLKNILRHHGNLVSRDMAVSLIYQAALILRDIHETGFVYGDVKPANFILDTFGRLSLIDFGSTAALNDRNYLKIYTPQYAAPEQKEKQKKPDFRFDVYGLGIMLQEMLNAGFSEWNPFGSDPVPGVNRQTEPFFQGSDQSGRMIDRICTRMTAASPAARYAGMGEVIAALELISPPNSAVLLKQLADSIYENRDTEESYTSEIRDEPASIQFGPEKTGAGNFGAADLYNDLSCTMAISTRPDFNYGSSYDTIIDQGWDT